MHARLRLRLRQIATFRLWDVVSNAKNRYRTHSLRLGIEPIPCIWVYYRTHSLHLGIEPIPCVWV